MYVHVCVCMCVSTCSYSIMIKPAQIPARQLNCLTAFLWYCLLLFLSFLLSFSQSTSVFSTLTCLPVISQHFLSFFHCSLPPWLALPFSMAPYCIQTSNPWSRATVGPQTLLLLFEYISYSCNILCLPQSLHRISAQWLYAWTSQTKSWIGKMPVNSSFWECTFGIKHYLQ